MEEEERDYVVFTDDDGNDVELDVIDYFDYKGDEYAILVDAEDDADDGDDGDDGCCCGCEHEEAGHETGAYIMKIIVNEDEDTEEFVPPADEDMDALIEIAQKRLDEYDPCDDECGCADECGCGCEHREE